MYSILSKQTLKIQKIVTYFYMLHNEYIVCEFAILADRGNRTRFSNKHPMLPIVLT